MLTSPDIVPKILDCLDWPSKGQAACVCRQWRLLAGSAEASLSAGKCWLVWQQVRSPTGPVLRHVQKCKLALCTDRLYLVDFSWPQLPALTAVHIEARLTTTLGWEDSIHWNNDTVRDLSVAVLRTKDHYLAHGNRNDLNMLALGVASSCLATLRVRAIVAGTGLLAYGAKKSSNPGGFYMNLQLTSTPELRQLLVCCHGVTVSGGQTVASPGWDRPALRFSGLRAAFLTNSFGVKLTSGLTDWASASESDRAQLQNMFQLCEMIDVDGLQGYLKGSLRLASDNDIMQQLQMFFEDGCYP